MGVLIVLGVIALIVAAVLRARAPVSAEPYRAAIAAPGERVESAQLDGNRVLVQLSGPNGEELVILDAPSGRIIGRIAVEGR